MQIGHKIAGSSRLGTPKPCLQYDIIFNNKAAIHFRFQFIHYVLLYRFSRVLSLQYGNFTFLFLGWMKAIFSIYGLYIKQLDIYLILILWTA